MIGYLHKQPISHKWVIRYDSNEYTITELPLHSDSVFGIERYIEDVTGCIVEFEIIEVKVKDKIVDEAKLINEAKLIKPFKNK